MRRVNSALPLLFLSLSAVVPIGQASAQTLEPTGFPQWDSTNQVLFFGYGSAVQIVRAYDEGVQKRGADIDIYKDFPGIREADVESLAAGPDGTVLIATILNFGNHDIREPILTYDSSGKLLRDWDPAPQYVEAIAYSKDDDAIFVLGGRYLPDGPYAPNYPLLIEYSRDGRILKTMIPASALKDQGRSFNANGETGETALKVTKDRIYIYAPSNREAVICDRDGAILAYRSISDIVDKISTEDGYFRVQTHALDFTDHDDIVLELLRGNYVDYTMDVVRINITTGEAKTVHKSVNGGRVWFLGIKDGLYLYLEDNKNLYIQAAEGQELQPLVATVNK